MTEGRGNAVREDDELDLDEDGDLGEINGDEVDSIQRNTEAEEYPDDGPLSVNRQVGRPAIGFGNFNGFQETSADGEDDYPPRRKDDDAGSIPDDSPSVQVSLLLTLDAHRGQPLIHFDC